MLRVGLYVKTKIWGDGPKKCKKRTLLGTRNSQSAESKVKATGALNSEFLPQLQSPLMAKASILSGKG